jgi:hypothetical protein
LTDQEQTVTKKAKAKSGGTKKAKKAEGGLPKKVAGVKVPKAVRKSGSLATLFNSQLGREVLADALIAAAGAAAAALTRTRAAKDTGKALADKGSQAASAGADLTGTASGAVAGVIGEAARTIIPANLLGEEAEDKDKDEDTGHRRYAHLSTDHNSRKTSRKSDKTVDKGSKR